MATKDSYEIDPERVADEVCDAKGIEDYSIRAGAILGARAMKAAGEAARAVPVAYLHTFKEPGLATVIASLNSERPSSHQHTAGCSYSRTALYAHPPAVAAGRVKVKELEWANQPYGTKRAGDYFIEDQGSSWSEDRYHLFFGGLNATQRLGRFATPEAAAEAASQHNEQRILSALAGGGAQEAHPDDLAVDRFASAMKAKLAKKRDEGRGGWEDKEACSNGHLSQLLVEHVKKGDPVDIGNLAMMLHQRGEVVADDRERYIAKVERRRAAQAMNSPRVIPFGYSCETCGAPDEEHCRSRPLAAEREGR